MNNKLIEWIFKITVGTLSAVCVAAVAVLLAALFDPEVSNDDVFAVIGPAFNTVIGAFVGLLGGLSLNDKFDKE